MLDIVYVNAFKRDYKKIRNNPKAVAAFTSVLEMLRAEKQLPAKYRPHALSGEFAGWMECHVRPDLLMVYRVDNDELILYLLRIGSHSELF